MTQRLLLCVITSFLVVIVLAILLLANIASRAIDVYQAEQREWQAIQRIKVVNEVCKGRWLHRPLLRATNNINWFECSE